MKKWKQFVLGASIACMGLFAVGCSNSNTEAATNTEISQEEAAAKVGETLIPTSEVDEQLQDFEQYLIAQYGEEYQADEEALSLYTAEREKALDYLIEQELLLKDAQEKGIEVTDEEVEEELSTTKSQFGSDEAFAEALEVNGISEEALKEQIKKSLSLNKVILDVIEGVEATDEELEAFYNENVEAYKVSPGAEMAHILVATEEEAKQVKQEYEQGATFEELAATYGTDGTKDIGGALGFIPYDSVQYDADFLAGAKDLQEGEVSEPVETQFGWHLIKVTNVQTEETTRTLAEVEEEVKEAVVATKQVDTFNSYLEDLKANANIEKYE